MIEGQQGTFATSKVAFLNGRRAAHDSMVRQLLRRSCAILCSARHRQSTEEEVTVRQVSSPLEVFQRFDSMDKQEQEAILEAYKLARQKTERLANRNRTDPGLVEDAVHEGILNVLKSKARTGIRNLPAYLVRTAYRELRRSAAVKRRDETRHVELDSIEQEGVACSRTRQLEASILVHQLKEQLPLEELQLVRWHDADELSFEEIAALKNISPEAARKRYERSLRTIRRLLGV